MTIPAALVITVLAPRLEKLIKFFCWEENRAVRANTPCLPGGFSISFQISEQEEQMGHTAHPLTQQVFECLLCARSYSKCQAGIEWLTWDCGFVGGRRGRESPYLSRRDKMAWDLDKREPRGRGLGAENSQVSGEEGKQTALGTRFSGVLLRRRIKQRGQTFKVSAEGDKSQQPWCA